VVANAGYLAKRYGCDQGFDTYRVGRAPASHKNRQAFEWLEGRAGGPLFLFLNYMDAHRPYNTTPRPGFSAPRDDGLIVRLYDAVMPGTAPVPAALRQQVIDQYDLAIANLDQEVGRLLDRFRELGLYDDAVVVITSDHGEYFGEHHLVEHSKEVYQQALHVPLLVKAPGQRAGRVLDTVVSSVDVPRLVLEHFPASRRERLQALFPYAPGNHPVLAEIYYTRTKDLFHPLWGHRFDRVRTALLDWPIKLIESSDGRHELYDLAADPRESSSLFETRRDLAERLSARLAGFRRAHPAHPMPDAARPLSPDEEEELRSLGYLGR
jgi:arylsulfatase A-like enzyme